MTTQVREWTVAEIEREEWGEGAWTSEPDKVQWVDEGTGLDCLMVRNGLGAWCGYVGVAEGHPYFNVEYSGCPQQCGEEWCEHRPESGISVHGGLTFSDFCHEPTREAWEKWRARMAGCREEAVKYPRGDSARAIRTTGHLVNDYDAYRTYAESRFVCHTPEPGRPARVWWLGFDCSHSGDLTPGLSHRSLGETYRDREYARREVTRLAAQLAAIGGN